ncbi:6254_t:CDS:2, partial [Dentiscutata heterogama]
KAENEIQELLKTYSSDNDEVSLNENEKAVADSMFGGDKYVGEIIMSAKLLYPPPVEANKEKQKIVDEAQPSAIATSAVAITAFAVMTNNLVKIIAYDAG